MQEPIEDGCCQNLISEDLTPLAVGFVRGVDDRTSAVTAADKLKQELGRHPVEREVAHLVQDEQLGAAERLQPMVQAVFCGIAVKLVQKVDHGREIDAGGALDSGHAQGNRQMGLTDAKRTQEQLIVTARGRNQVLAWS